MLNEKYVELLRRFNITQEDLDYSVSAFGPDWNLDDLMPSTNNNANNNNNDNDQLPSCYNSCGPCHCNGYVRRFAGTYLPYHGYVSLLVCGFGILANLLNVAVLTRNELWRAPVNRILTALATADILVMLEYMIFAVYEYFVLPERRSFPYGWAVFVLFHMHFSQLLHTVSIVLTLELAVYRYVVVKYPQCSRSWCATDHYRTAMIASVFVSALACAPSFFVFGIREQRIYEDGKLELLYHVDARGSNGETYGILYRLNFWLLAVIIKLLPCLVLTVISWCLIRALYKAKARRQLLLNQMTTATTTTATTDNQTTTTATQIDRTERRADRTTRMLVAVLLLFLLTEFPQGVLGLLSALLGQCFFRSCYHSLGEIMDIMALFNGAVNFILYCAMSRQFRVAFSQLFIKSNTMGLRIGTCAPAAAAAANTHQTEIVQSTCV